MTIIDKNYIITSIEQSPVDEKFLKYSYQYLKKYPFMWRYLVKEIICKKEISYFRDTTGIIHIETIEFNKLSYLFELLKAYLNIGVIDKIIYKKEFIILHFHQNFHLQYFIYETFLLAINLYFFLLTQYQNIFTICYGAKLLDDKKSYLIEIMLKYHEKLYLFSSNPNFNLDFSSNIKKLYLCDFPKHDFKKQANVEIFKISYSEKDYEDQIKKIVMLS